MAGQKLIFIVDDDPMITMLVVERFTEEGYKVIAFNYGEACISALGRKPDLIVLDYYFVNNEKNVLNGMEIFVKIKEIEPDIPVIMLSGQEKGEIVLEFATRGIYDYVIKDENLIYNLGVAIKELFIEE